MYVKRREEIIHAKDGISTMRIARFLQPSAGNDNQLSKIPETPFVSDLFTHHNLQKWPLNVHLTGWKKPHKNWLKWVNRLVINHATTWIETGIMDGIQASLHEIPCNYDLVLGVCEFWCSETTSFVFPWGESTITLEDVMILGGLPVMGESINKPIRDNLVNVDAELRRARRELSGKSKKRGDNGEKEATHSAWIKHFMEEEEEGEIEHKEGEFEHVAFLSLWLSRFVFPDLNEGFISDYVFNIAIHLSRRTPIALAPAVLANLYQQLTLLTQNAIDLPFDSRYHASGLFKIVQLWVCERFPDFGAKLTKPLQRGDPRVARWDDVEFEVTLSQVRSRLKLGEGFQWRPYASDLENWDHLPFYGESEQKFSNCAGLDDCFLSFGQFLCLSELYGHKTNCREKYQPHRVAMQFGYDQDIPGEFRVSAVDWDKVGLYIPSRTFDPGVSRSYYNWWKGLMLRHQEAASKLFKAFRPKRGRDSGELLVERQEIGKCQKGDSSCASPQLMLEEKSDKRNASSNLDDVPLALRLCTNVANKEAPCEDEPVKGQASAALRSPQIKLKGSLDSNDGKGVLEAKNVQPSEFLDMDDVPLYSRLQSFARSSQTRRSSESYASTENEANPLQGKNPTEGGSMGKTLEAGREGEGDTGGMSSEGVLDRVAKLERSVALLGARKSSHADFSNSD